VYALAGCPSEPKQAYRNEQGADDRNGRAFLRLELTIDVILWLLHVIRVGEEGGHDDKRADEQAKEGEAHELLLALVDADEHDREGLEPNVEESVDEADIDVEGEHDWLLEIERKGRTRTSTARSRREIVAAAISGADLIEGFPVALRRPRARRYRMLDAEVSG
jgi:hypothetical protein